MAGQRQPVGLVLAKGKKHLTKTEIEAREQSEVKPCTDDIAPPSFLTAAQKKEFRKIADQLDKLGVMGETDCDTLARYVVAQSLYAQAVKDIRAVEKDRPKGADADPMAVVAWVTMLEKLDKRVDRYYKQATAAAAKLGLTISDRCKLVVPKPAEKPKENKFDRFGQAANGP